MGLVGSQSADRFVLMPHGRASPLSPPLGGCRELWDKVLSGGKMGRVGWELVRALGIEQLVDPVGPLREVINSEPSSKGIMWVWQWWSPSDCPLHSWSSFLCHFWQPSNRWTLQSLMNSWQLHYSAPISCFFSPTDYRWIQRFLHSQDGKDQSQRSNFIFPPFVSTFQPPQGLLFKGMAIALHGRTA